MNIDEIVDTYYRKIYKLCLYYLGNREEAEEIVHEIFIKALKKQAGFKGESSIYTWLYRIAVNTVVNYINRKKIVQFISFENLGQAGETAGDSAAVDPALKLEQDETRRIKIRMLKKCIVQLSNREKTAFYFFYYDGLKQKEIAKIMKTSLSAVESLVHKAVKKIKKCAHP